MACIATVTIGQSPRSDVTPELVGIVPEARWVERGALDGLDEAEIAALAPEPGEFPLVTRLRDGRAVVLGERAVTPLVQRAIREVEAEADLVMLLCTGELDLVSAKPLLFPGRILAATAAALCAGQPVAVLTPHEGQTEGQRDRWRARGVHPTILVASPYAPADFARVGREARASGARLVVLDCLGYTRAMKAAVADASRLPVLLPRSLAARLAAELLDT
jgi:protein AroM